MDTQGRTNIKYLLKRHSRNTVLTGRQMLAYGISRDLQRVYTRSGWLKRIGPGAYTVLDETASLDGALYALQTSLGRSIHQGGYSALRDLYGKTHNLSVKGKTELFAFRGEKLPLWFATNHGAGCLVTTSTFLPATLGLVNFNAGGFTVKVSALERSMLEMLYLAPGHHSLREAYQVLELLTTVKPALFQTLLEHCASIKVKRLFFYMSEKIGHPWLKRIDMARIDLGSGIREIEKGGTLDKKYKIVVGDLGSI